MELVNYEPPKIRSMEELKNRYYSINRTLIKMRMNDASAVEKAQLLSSMSYDMNREMERKKNLEILNNRTPEQIEEEEALYLEARRIDQNEKKIARERENLLRLLSTRDMYGGGGPASAGLAGQVVGGGGPGTGIIIPSNSITIPSSTPSNTNISSNGPLSPSVGKNSHGAPVAGAAGTHNVPTKKRKKAPKGSNQAEDAIPGSTVSSSTSISQTKVSSNNRRPSNASSVSDVTLSNLPQGIQVKKEKLTPGAYLRSQKMTPVVSTKQQRVQTTLANLVDKLEADLKVVKMRRGSASGVGLFPTGSTSSTSGGAGAASGAGSSSSTVSGLDGNFGVKREGTVDESGTSGQKKKKRKE
ncbi:swr complex subunit [Modicella reniformis]|uniref:Swr complex subunit n=1 Tax=Modicella reniformis TaxID=1440133 RepID=A0A9P6M1E2_9FUNG|nr:swr complex subunit [Modicella reniformis]